MLIAVQCMLVLAFAWATFLELALTLPVKVGPGGYTGEDSDHAMCLDRMPWPYQLLVSDARGLDNEQVDEGRRGNSMPWWHRDAGAPIGGFGYKTTWIAVKAREPEEIAEALGLIETRPLDWVAGTDLAYKHGVYVTPRLGDWTLAHGGDGLHHPFESDGTYGARAPWLGALSARLGEVQYFHTHRVPDDHQWAIAIDGEVLREFDCCGMTGEFHGRGEPTAAERAIGKGTRIFPEDTSDWTDAEWDAFYETVPSEWDVMRIAGIWSIDPSTLRNEEVTGDGVFGEVRRAVSETGADR